MKQNNIGLIAFFLLLMVSLETPAQKVVTKLPPGISFKRLETYYDSGYYPKSLYFNLRLAELTGLHIDSANNCKLVVTVWDNNAKAISLPKDPRKYVAKTFKEGSQINILMSIPLNPLDPANARYNAKLFLVNEQNDTLVTCSSPLFTTRKTYLQ